MALRPASDRRPATPDDLRDLPLLEDLPEALVAWLAEHGEHLAYGTGERVFDAGAPAEEMTIILEGAIQLVLEENGHSRLYDTFRAPSVMGVLPYSRMTTFTAAGVAVEPVRLVALPKKHFQAMLAQSEELGRRLVARLSDRVREFTRTEQQGEKMMALGKLAAGLAHELNNPAAAIGRTAADLRERLDRLPALAAGLVEAGVGEEALEQALAVRHAVRDRGADTLSTLDRADAEDALADRLEALGDLDDPFDLAAALVDAGFRAEDLDALPVDGPVAAALLPWVEATLATDRLLEGIVSASQRISTLVASVKTYSHLDQAPTLQPTDVREGLGSTLTMLSHAIRAKNLTVERDLPADLPAVHGYPGELNQVWTNLLDNAIDALGEGGRLTLRARSEGPFICVQVEDDGPGIPEDVRSRIFEPFFTTKGVGEGSGLGLDVVRRIVKRHEGGIDVESEPGRTVFTVRLPVAER